jgi:hypothetical protein
VLAASEATEVSGDALGRGGDPTDDEDGEGDEGDCDHFWAPSGFLVMSALFGRLCFDVQNLRGMRAEFDSGAVQVGSRPGGTKVVLGLRPLPSQIGNQEECAVADTLFRESR